MSQNELQPQKPQFQINIQSHSWLRLYCTTHTLSGELQWIKYTQHMLNIKKWTNFPYYILYIYTSNVMFLWFNYAVCCYRLFESLKKTLLNKYSFRFSSVQRYQFEKVLNTYHKNNSFCIAHMFLSLVFIIYFLYGWDFTANYFTCIGIIFENYWLNIYVVGTFFHKFFLQSMLCNNLVKVKTFQLNYGTLLLFFRCCCCQIQSIVCIAYECRYGRPEKIE